jgi:hypothetical protein
MDNLIIDNIETVFQNLFIALFIITMFLVFISVGVFKIYKLMCEDFSLEDVKLNENEIYGDDPTMRKETTNYGLTKEKAESLLNKEKEVVNENAPVWNYDMELNKARYKSLFRWWNDEEPFGFDSEETYQGIEKVINKEIQGALYILDHEMDVAKINGREQRHRFIMGQVSNYMNKEQSEKETM